ncbi:hypothetical protein CEXT_390601 [Caerostris extrusa]|uniref:Uncharacterized protein n=1 Tax=Caerostris extrusa TaxID=172846 RepID=A0AAV4UWY0_CAEEX|nr:hypothetical protein CEXT_390601 [Caerostris extrusa]
MLRNLKCGVTCGSKYAKIRDTRKASIEDTMEEVLSRVGQKDKLIYVGLQRGESMLVKQMHKYSDDPSVCDLYVAKEDIVRSDWVLALTKNSPFLPQFNEK